MEHALRLTEWSTDLYLLHAPYGGKEGRLGAWKALVEAVQAGKVRSIGVSNYGVHHLDELEKFITETDSSEGQGKGGVLSVNQVELHPWLSRPDIVSWCEQRGVVLEVSATMLTLMLGIGTGVSFDFTLSWRHLTQETGLLPACTGYENG